MSCSHSNNKQRRAARASRASGRLQKIIRPSAFAAACSSGLVSEGDDDPSSNKRHRHRREAVVTWRRETATASAGRLRRPRRPRLPGRAGAPRPLDRRRRNEPRFPHAGFIIEDRRHRPARSVRASVSSSIGEFRASYEHRRTRRGERAGTSGIARPMPLERSCIEFLAAIAFACAVSSAGCTFRTSSDSFSASRYMAIHVSGAPCHRRRQMMILLLAARAWDGQSRAQQARARAQGKRADRRRLSCLPCRREGPRDLSRARSRAGDRSPASPPRRRCRTPQAPAGRSHPSGPWRAPPGTRRRNFRGSARRPVDDDPCRSRHPRALRGKSDVTCGPAGPRRAASLTAVRFRGLAVRGKRQAQEQNGGASRPPHAVPAFLALFRAVYVSNFFSFSKFIFSFPKSEAARFRPNSSRSSGREHFISS